MKVGDLVRDKNGYHKGLGIIVDTNGRIVVVQWHFSGKIPYNTGYVIDQPDPATVTLALPALAVSEVADSRKVLVALDSYYKVNSNKGSFLGQFRQFFFYFTENVALV